MHCNYQNLSHTYAMFASNWKELKVWETEKEGGGYNEDKATLVARQVVGLIQLVELPAYERYLFAQNKIKAKIAGEQIEVESNVKCKYDNSEFFPDFDESQIQSRSGFGFESYASIYGRVVVPPGFLRLRHDKEREPESYRAYIEQKLKDSQTYSATANTKNSPVYR